jgi:hypothetical protein
MELSSQPVNAHVTVTQGPGFDNNHHTTSSERATQQA